MTYICVYVYTINIYYIVHFNTLDCQMVRLFSAQMQKELANSGNTNCMMHAKTSQPFSQVQR